jgi:hypothetical protein
MKHEILSGRKEAGRREFLRATSLLSAASALAGRDLSLTLRGERQEVPWILVEGAGDGYRALVTAEYKVECGLGHGVVRYTDPANDPYELSNRYKDPACAAEREAALAELKRVADSLGDRYFIPGYQPRTPSTGRSP